MNIKIDTIEWNNSPTGKRRAMIKSGQDLYTFWLNDRKEEDMKKLLQRGVEIDAEVKISGEWNNIISVKGEEIFGEQQYPQSSPTQSIDSKQQSTLEEKIDMAMKALKNKGLGEDELTHLELQLSILNVELSKQYSESYRIYKQKVFDFTQSLKDSSMSKTAIKDEAEKEAWMEKATFLMKENLLESIRGVLFGIKDRVKFMRK